MRRVLTLLLLAALTACAGSDSTPTIQTTPGVGSLFVAGSFDDRGRIPQRFTCDGAGTSPAVSWSGAPAEARSFAVAMTDPDAPGGTFLHWLVWNIGTGVPAFGEGVLPGGAVTTRNGFGKQGYGGPCPPKGPAHTYELTVFALSRRLDLEGGAPSDDVLKAIAGALLAKGRVRGTYARS